MFNYASLNLKTDLYLFRDHVHDPGYCYGYLCFHFAVALHSCFDSLTGFFHVVSCSFLFLVGDLACPVYYHHFLTDLRRPWSNSAY